MEYRTSQNRARRNIPTRPEARHDTVSRELAMSKYPVPRDFTARFMFCKNAAFLVSSASLRACASQMPGYDKGTSAGAILACRLIVIDTFFTLHGHRRQHVNLFCWNFIMERFLTFGLKKCEQRLYLIKWISVLVMVVLLSRHSTVILKWFYSNKSDARNFSFIILYQFYHNSLKWDKDLFYTEYKGNTI
jgi:hypothetical protein